MNKRGIMKIAKIKHIRCGSYENSTLVMIPDNMTGKELELYVDRAARSALAAEQEVDGIAAPDYPNKDSLLKRLPKETTLEQFEKVYQKNKTEYGAWYKKRDESRKFFSYWLNQVSDGKIIPFYEFDLGEFDVRCDWGHNHELNPNYSEGDIA